MASLLVKEGSLFSSPPAKGEWTTCTEHRRGKAEGGIIPHIFQRRCFMIYDVREGILTIEGEDGQRIGIGIGGPTMKIFVGEAGASYTSDTVGIGINTPQCRFEVRADGAVGVGRKAE